MHFKLNLLFSLMNVSLIVDFFKYKNINHGILFQCNRNQQSNDFPKVFNNHGIFITIVENQKKIILPKSYTKLGIFVDTSCRQWASAFHSVSFEGTNSWIFVTKNLSNTITTLANYPIEIDSDVTVAYKTENFFVLHEVYNTGSRYKGTLVIKRLGCWNSSLDVSQNDRKDLRGAIIKVSVISLRTDKVVGETIERFIERGLVKEDTVHRIKYFTLLKYMRDMFNMSYELQRVESWGYMRNGSFDGMVGALSHGTAEIGGSPVFPRSDRALHVQYVSEVWPSRHCFIFRHPKYPGGFYTIYTRPLSDVVWYCSISMLAISAIVLWITLRVGRGDDSTLSMSVLTIWSAFCQQGSCIEHHVSSVKLVLFSTFVGALIIYQHYNATIVSSLLQEAPKNIRTLKDLLNSDLKVGIDDMLYNRDYFKRTTDPIAIVLYKKKIVTLTHQNFFTTSEGMAMVKKGGFAFHVDTTLAFPIIKETFNEREICETSTVQLYPLQRMGVVVKKFSPYKEIITYGIRRMYEAGLPMRVQSVTDTRMSECVRTPDSSVFRVNLREFSMPLVTLAIGTLCSIMLLFCEVSWARLIEARQTYDHRKFAMFRYKQNVIFNRLKKEVPNLSRNYTK